MIYFTVIKFIFQQHATQSWPLQLNQPDLVTCLQVTTPPERNNQCISFMLIWPKKQAFLVNWLLSTTTKSNNWLKSLIPNMAVILNEWLEGNYHSLNILNDCLKILTINENYHLCLFSWLLGLIVNIDGETYNSLFCKSQNGK